MLIGDMTRLNARRFKGKPAFQDEKRELTFDLVNKRAKVIHEIQRELMRDGTHICLYSQDRFSARWPYVHANDYFHPNSDLMGEKIWMEKK